MLGYDYIMIHDSVKPLESRCDVFFVSPKSSPLFLHSQMFVLTTGKLDFWINHQSYQDISNMSPSSCISESVPCSVELSQPKLK